MNGLTCLAALIGGTGIVALLVAYCDVGNQRIDALLAEDPAEPETAPGLSTEEN
jgi:hypothetical protein